MMLYDLNSGVNLSASSWMYNVIGLSQICGITKAGFKVKLVHSSDLKFDQVA